MSKQTSLAEAIRATVTPDATVLFAFTHNRSHAAAFEVARQFRDRHCLTLAATGLLDYASILQAAGALKRTESAFAGNTYPAPAPSRVLAEAIAATPDSDPHWTNLTMTLRLMAGAMGWPFIPTRSLHGSDLWRGANRARIANPFGGDEVSVIAALRPDVAFIHAPIADTLGNTIIHGPDAEESWGAWAAHKLVVTAERVVSPAELRSFGPRTGIPGQLVTHVVACPFGAHPQGQFVWTDAEGVESYAEDYAFRQELKQLSRQPAALRAWVEDWVFGTDHQSYLDRLGSERLASLVTEARQPSPPAAVTDDPASPEEQAAVQAMRFAQGEAKSGRSRTLFAGIGLAHLAAWAAEAECRAEGVPVDLVAETGMVGFHPLAGDPYLFNRPNAAQSLFHASFVRTLGAIGGQRGESCLVLLAAAQIDAAGNINSSQAADGRFIVGSGGANDLAAGQGRTLVVMPLKPGRCAETLPFVTSPIQHLAGIATDLGLLTPIPGSTPRRLQIVTVTCAAGDEARTIEQIRARTGFDLAVAADLTRHDPATASELASLRRFDPRRELLA